MTQQRQSVGVVITLVGTQDVEAKAQQVGTDNAVVAVRLGKALIYLHDRVTAVNLAREWLALGKYAEFLPRELDRSSVLTVPGMPEPAVLVDAAASPPTNGRLVRPAVGYSHLMLTVGRVMFNVRDLGAYGSATGVFRQAAALADATFPSGRSTVLAHQTSAAEQASRLFLPSRGRRRHAIDQSQPARVQQPPRIRVKGCELREA